MHGQTELRNYTGCPQTEYVSPSCDCISGHYRDPALDKLKISRHPHRILKCSPMVPEKTVTSVKEPESVKQFRFNSPFTTLTPKAMQLVQK